MKIKNIWNDADAYSDYLDWKQECKDFKKGFKKWMKDGGLKINNEK